MSIKTSNDNNDFENYEWKKLIKYFDFVNVKAYDFHSSLNKHTGFVAPLFIGRDDPYKTEDTSKFAVKNFVKEMIGAGVPEEKIVVGIQFYGIGWQGVESINNGLYQESTGKSTNGTWDQGKFEYSDLVKNYISAKNVTKFIHSLS